MEKNQRNPRKRLNSLILLVAFTAVMLIVSTYAWFSAQKTVTLSNLEGKVNVAEGMQISLNAKDWSQEINFEDYDTSSEGIAVYGTRADGTSLALQYGETAHNHLPSELLPTSTTGLDKTSLDATANDGIGDLNMSFFQGTIAESGTGIDKVTSMHSIYKADESVTSATSPNYAGYFAIDFFINNSSRLATGESQGVAKETLQLNTNSVLELVSGGLTTTGLQNTARVALALYTPDTTAGKVAGTSTQAEILAAFTGANSTISDVAIWEPNSDQHVDYIVNNNNLLYWNTTEEDLYLDAFGSYNTTTDVYESKTSATGRSRYTATDKVPAAPVKTTKIANIYKWDEAVEGLHRQVALQTKKSAANFSTVDGGVRNLISIKSPSTKIYDQGDEEGVVAFQIFKNQVSRLRLYVWLEGQDVDCINYASHGSGVHLDLGLVKGATPGQLAS